MGDHWEGLSEMLYPQKASSCFFQKPCMTEWKHPVTSWKLRGWEVYIKLTIEPVTVSSLPNYYISLFGNLHTILWQDRWFKWVEFFQLSSKNIVNTTLLDLSSPLYVVYSFLSLIFWEMSSTLFYLWRAEKLSRLEAKQYLGKPLYK